MVPADIHFGDMAVLSTVAIAGAMCLASGLFDELLLFVSVSTGFGILVSLRIEELHIQDTLAKLHTPYKQTDLISYLAKSLGVSMVDGDTEAIIFSAVLVASTIAVAILARFTLNRYSPALSVVLYLSCVNVLVMDRSLEHTHVNVLALACMIVISLTSNSILRLHIAAAIFSLCLVVVSELKENGVNGTIQTLGDSLDGSHVREVVPIDLANPLAVSFTLLVGFGACLAHDIIVFFVLGTALKAFHMTYVSLTALITVDTLTEFITGINAATAFQHLRQYIYISGQSNTSDVTCDVHIKEPQLSALTWTGALSKLNKENMRNPSYETLTSLAPLFCVYFSLSMVARRLISPTVVWRQDRFKEAIGTALGAFFALALLLLLTNDDEVRRIGTSPALLTILSALLYLQISRLTETTLWNSGWRTDKWYTMRYWVNAFPDSANADSFGKDDRRGFGPPPFVLLPDEDFRVRDDLKEFTQQMGRYRAAAQDVRQVMSKVERKKGSANPQLLIRAAKLHVTLVGAATKASDLAESVALQLRELASDAETERETLQVLQGYTKTQKRFDHQMAIRRQSQNADANFKWLNESLVNAETQAERLVDVASVDIRSAVNFFQDLFQDTRLEQPTVNALYQSLKESSAPVLDASMMDLLLHREMKPNSSLVKGPNGIAPPRLQVSVGRGNGLDTIGTTTPYAIAMENKRLPDVKETKGNEDDVPDLQDRRSSSSNSNSKTSPTSASSSGSHPDSHGKKKRWLSFFPTPSIRRKSKSHNSSNRSLSSTGSTSSAASPGSSKSTFFRKKSSRPSSKLEEMD